MTSTSNTFVSIRIAASVLVSQHGLNEYNGGAGEDIEGDIKVKVVSGHNTSHQGEDAIEKSPDRIIKGYSGSCCRTLKILIQQLRKYTPVFRILYFHFFKMTVISSFL